MAGTVRRSTITLSATDTCSGAKFIRSYLDGTASETTGSSASLTISADGTHTVTYFAQDYAGNSEGQHSLIVKIDQMAPSIMAAAVPAGNGNGWNNTEVTVSFTL